jgi:hypothetical protein
LNWRSALACFFDAQPLRHEAKYWSAILLKAVNGNSGTQDVVEPELLVEVEFMIEEFRFPSTRVTTGELLVETDACWRAINFRERALTSDATIYSNALAEWVANASHLTSLMKAQCPIL